VPPGPTWILVQTAKEAIVEDPTKLKLKIVVGSTRPTRAVDKVSPWVVRRAEGHGSFDVEVLDLRDWPLPFFAEHIGTIGDRSDPTYSDPLVRAWNRTMKEADALLIITAEYLHSVPGVLKNALDSVFASYALRNKPLGSIGYSGGVAAGVRAVEHLAHIAIEAEMVPLRNTVLIPFVGEAFDASGDPTDQRTDIALTIVLDDLDWWGSALREARARGELAPGTARMMAGLQATRSS
jgi:NAD(P)H-dependent FMN reductase